MKDKFSYRKQYIDKLVVRPYLGALEASQVVKSVAKHLDQSLQNLEYTDKQGNSQPATNLLRNIPAHLIEDMFASILC
jgi:hypothetical protein